ncbi:MAG TPA: glycine dehydrogenase (aminomethyl-transferring), partial [Acidimicrobiia bacterium]|nr:glycine dehydrogenase (aminomethyl-transferring) [Acidimicrobiia bacterium]
MTLRDLEPTRFVDRHVGPDGDDQATMLSALGLASLDDLARAVVPASIRSEEPLALPGAVDEAGVVDELRQLADANQVYVSLLGTGYADTVTPPVIQRNVLENPAWYTAYTPYQPEISQGRLEALLNFQTMVADLTGMDLANASLLDESTAAAEAMTLCHRVNAKQGATFVVDPGCHPQTIAVVATRAAALGLDVVVTDPDAGDPGEGVFGALLQEPSTTGRVGDRTATIAALHDRGVLVAVATDLLACTLLVPPGEQGADVVVGSAQRFGVPLGFGGPHAGFLATRERYQRSLPGRLVGVSVDAAGRPALRLALQTREQHIRRERATSNICTAQVLLAVIAGLYAVYHGPDGLARIARRVHRLAVVLAAGLRAGGVDVPDGACFDTVAAHVSGRAEQIAAAARADGINLRVVDEDTVVVALDETTTPAVVERVWRAFGCTASVPEIDARADDALPAGLARTSAYLTHPVFRQHHS